MAELGDNDLMDKTIRLINGVGFPIVVSIALFWFNIESLSNQTEMIRKFEQSIVANTALLTRVSNEGLGRGEVSRAILRDLDIIKDKCK